MNPAFERLLARIDDELNQDVMPTPALVARGKAARAQCLAALENVLDRHLEDTS